MAMHCVQNSPGDENVLGWLAHLEKDHQAKEKSEQKDCEMPFH